MTWVAGSGHIGCARCISDVKVTIKFSNGKCKYYDGVRKVHIIGAGFVIAFAGSIKLAFKIIDGLMRNFYNKLDDRIFVEPRLVAQKTQKAIKYFYAKEKTNIDNHVEFLLFIQPTVEYQDFGVYKLVSPKFEIISPNEHKPCEIMTIGNGAIVKEYQKIAKKYGATAIEIPGEDGEKPDLMLYCGRTALEIVFSEAKEYQNAGISRAMHICLITSIDANIKELPKDDNTDFPVVANSLEELNLMLRGKGIRLADCYAEA